MARRKKLTCSVLIDADHKALRADGQIMLAERDVRLATDTRTPAQVWLGEPEPSRSALA